MAPTITIFEQSPDGGKGLARDTRVRWALEEVGQPYEARLVSFRAMRNPRIWRSILGQIPTYEEGDLTLFETGAITPFRSPWRCRLARLHVRRSMPALPSSCPIPLAQVRRHYGLVSYYSGGNTARQMRACTPWRPSTTCVTAKSAATLISE